MDPQTIFKTHKQSAGYSCAASAHEFLAKLHDKLPASEFPLQGDTKAAHQAGFQFQSFLDGIGFVGHEDWLEPQALLDLLADESKQGRYPLVSICTRHDRTGNYWHIVLASLKDGEVALIDPAMRGLRTHNNAETLDLLKFSASIPTRNNKVGFLTYTSAVA